MKVRESEVEGDDVTMALFAFLIDFITGDLYIDEIGFLMHSVHYICPFYVSNDFGSIICKVTGAELHAR